MATIAPRDFSKYMNALLNEYGDEVIEIVISCADETSKASRSMLRSNNAGAFKNKTGAYRRGWRASLVKNRLGVVARVYNATDWQLTHLLENGHDIVKGGKVIGHVDAFPHIADVNKWAIQEFEDELTERIAKL